jgi:hypothetical protein
MQENKKLMQHLSQSIYIILAKISFSNAIIKNIAERERIIRKASVCILTLCITRCSFEININ